MTVHYIEAIILKAVIIKLSKVNHYYVEIDVTTPTLMGRPLSLILEEYLWWASSYPKEETSYTHSKKEYVRGTQLYDFTVYSDRLCES